MSQKPKAGRSQKVARNKKVEKTQAERFIEAARAIGVDESGREFDRVLKKLLPPKRRGN